MKYLLLAVGLIFLSGCSLVTVNAPAGTSGGMIFSNQNYGGKNGAGSPDLKMESLNKYVVIGPVETQGSAQTILGLFGTGDTGYGLLVKKAKAIGGDDVINLYADTKHTSVLLGAYTQSTVTYYGTAIKYFEGSARPNYGGDLEVDALK